MKHAITLSFSLALALTLGACQSKHESGVKSNYRTQWSTVDADVKTTTSAAEDVLRDAEMKDVKSNSTNVDGKATGKKADGTEVKVAVRREKGDTSQVSVTVGTLGDPSLGAEFARKIKESAEGGSSTSTSTTRPATHH
jgi:hypothetical protein